MLTDHEIELASYAFALRHDEEGAEVWFCPADRLFPEAHNLWQRGWLDRRQGETDYLWRFSDEGMKALAVGAMQRTSPADNN